MKNNKNIKAAKKILTQKSDILIGIAVVGCIGLLITATVLTVQSSGPKIVYTPTKACDLLTPSEAYELLGDKIDNIKTNEPKITGNVAQSQCAYSDKNTDGNLMKVAAVQVVSGINDIGDRTIKNVFEEAKNQDGIQMVDSLGEAAYFDVSKGQLNVLKGHNWVRISYGVGEAPEANTIEDAKIVSQKVFN